MSIFRPEQQTNGYRRPVIRQRGKSTQVIVYVGRDPLTGRKRWVSRQVPGTGRAALKEAKQIEAKLLAEVAAGRHQEAHGVKVGELVDRWLEWRQAVKPMSPGTAANYRRCIDLKIKPALGDLAVSRLDTATLDRFYAELRQRGSKCQHCYRRMRNGKQPMRPGETFQLAFTGKERVHQTDCVQGIPMTASAIRDVHAVLSGALQQAVVWGWRTDNPARSTTPPAQAKAEVAPPQAQEAVRLIETATAEDPELGLFLMLAVMLGSRRGELCSLRWTDVDFNHGEVLIDSGVIYIPGQPLIDQDRTKNYTKRRVAVGPTTLELLRAHRVEQAKMALASGVSLAPGAYVFSHQPDGSEPIRPDGVSHRFTKLAQRLGVRCRLHDLRHFMVTQLVAAGVDVRTVAGRAGHIDGGRTTLGTYAHFQHAQDRQAAEFMERLLVPTARPDSR
jgi:integrase